jgi:hypothetical protein
LVGQETGCEQVGPVGLRLTWAKIGHRNLQFTVRYTALALDRLRTSGAIDRAGSSAIAVV